MPRKIRPIRIEGDLAYVPLTKGYQAVIDAADVSLVSDRNWNAAEIGGHVYARAARGLSEGGGVIDMRQAILGDLGGQRVYQAADLDYRRKSLFTKTRATKRCRAPSGRDIRIVGNVGFVPLTRGYEAKIDAKDVPAVARHDWCVNISNGKPYAVTVINGEYVYLRQFLGQYRKYGIAPLDYRSNPERTKQRVSDETRAPNSPRKLVLTPRNPDFSLARNCTTASKTKIYA